MGLIVAAPSLASAQESSEPGTAHPLLAAVVIALGILTLAVLWKRDAIRPGSFKRIEPADAPPPEAGLVLFAMLIGCLIVSAIAALVVTQAQGVDPDVGRTMPQQGVFTLLVGSAGVAAGVGAMLLARRTWKLDRFCFTGSGYVTGLLLGLALYPLLLSVTMVSGYLFRLIGTPPGDGIAHETLNTIVAPETGAWRWAVIAGAVVLTPIFEELLFRGLLQSAVVSIVRNRWAAVLIASALFVGPHIGPAIQPHVLPAIGGLGIAMGVAYERTGKISIPIAMHAMYNGINVGVSFLIA
ncbi:MAG: hypothetical protein Phyf2KO_22970 [Phycisphaerales bacterium]